MGHWEDHFPRLDLGGGYYTYQHWDADHWYEEPPPGIVQPTDPVGAGAFELALENGVTVTFSWASGLAKMYAGNEKRSNLIDDPAVRYEGTARLLLAETRAARVRLAKYAAQGSAFLLGLPYEAVAITGAPTADTVSVTSTTLLDWCVPGANALIQHPAHGSHRVTVQSKTSTTITVDTITGVALGAYAGIGGMIMPAVSIFLDAQQSFSRYQTAVEMWNLRARNATGPRSSATLVARLALDAVKPGDPALAGIEILARTPGAAGNAITFSMVADGGVLGSLTEDTGLGTVVFHFSNAGNTPASRIGTVLATSTLVQATGTVGVVTGIDPTSAFAATNLAGGVDASYAEIGVGATLTTFETRPVWDRAIEMEEATTESINAMNEPMDLGGLPFTAQTASYADWGRQIRYRERMRRAEWQWVKKMLWTLGGRWKSFWLSTYRADLDPVSVGVGTLTVTGGEEYGDALTWWPKQRQCLAIITSTGTTVYARITNIVDGTATAVLTLVDGAGAPLSLGATPQRVSWLEQCRLESDEVSVFFDDQGFAFDVQARVVRQP